MTIAQIFVTFFSAEFIFFIMVLPFFKPLPPQEIPQGHAASAPENPRLGIKFAISLGLSAIFTIIVYFLLNYLQAKT